MKVIRIIYKIVIVGAFLGCFYYLLTDDFDYKFSFWPIKNELPQDKPEAREQSVINIMEYTSEGNDVKQFIIVTHNVLEDVEFRKLEMAITNWSMMYIRNTTKKDYKVEEFSKCLEEMLHQSSLSVMYGVQAIHVFPMTEKVEFDKDGKCKTNNKMK